jgi:hypothetical protein
LENRINHPELVRIAISGSHATGKTTLVDDLASALNPITVVPEPFYEILSEGGLFSQPPSIEDYEVQLDRSIDVLQHTNAAAIFDRCPADFLAYLATFGSDSAASIRRVFRSAADALSRLDLIVFVPIERPDRIQLDSAEGLRLRKRVDLRVREILLDDIWGLDLPVVEVRGTPEHRLKLVLQRVAEVSAS